MDPQLQDAPTTHIVPQPRFIFFLRVFQAVVAVIALGLSAAAISQWGLLSGSLGFVIFVAIATWIIVAYHVCTAFWLPSWYNCWAVLSLDIFGVIFWLPAFAALGSWASVHSALDNSLYGVNDNVDCSLLGSGYCYNNIYKGWQLSAAAAGMGGLEFVLFLVTLITFSVFLHRHRMSGAPMSYGDAYAASAGGQPPAEMHNMGYGKEQGGPPMQPPGPQPTMPPYNPQPAYAEQAYVRS